MWFIVAPARAAVLFATKELIIPTHCAHSHSGRPSLLSDGEEGCFTCSTLPALLLPSPVNTCVRAALTQQHPKHPTRVDRAPKNRIPAYLGLGAAAIVGYYLYTAGGDPNVAKKEMKHDAASASTTVRDQLPGRGKEAKASVEEAFARVGSEVDSTNRIAQGQKVLEETKDRAGSKIMNAVDQADLKLEEEAAKAKKSVGGWFGGSRPAGAGTSFSFVLARLRSWDVIGTALGEDEDWED
ncbi:uncharacterized protein LAJ45_10499 [Morchella importuna]|uniref:uncharacterized protein n=1 Tax=Morchella importuna TaxID=1174673 RepID=UPI001E8CA247|nr:uncharacterized protein LAJ45_10499 [Morchella importuna]KAH8145529.1 hypothetical protein LAJ45_10499 [Morchella importuna]